MNMKKILRNLMIIYKVTNKINNKIYIGKTIRGFEKRQKEHEKSIQKGNNGIHMPFHCALKKYGIENFVWEIIDTALTHQELCEKEKEWIKRLDSQNINKGYNITEGGEYGDTISQHPNKDEILKRISTGLINSYKEHPERRERLSEVMSGEGNPMYGRHDHVYGLQEYAKNRRNKKNIEIFSIEKATEISAKISLANKNKKITPEQREHYRLANLGEKNPFAKNLPQDVIDSILKEYLTTQVLRDIADKFNTTVHLVRKYLKQYNLYRQRSSSEVVSGENNPRFIQVSENLKNIIQYLYSHHVFTVKSVIQILLLYKIDLSRHKIRSILKERNVYQEDRKSGFKILKRNADVKYLETILNDKILKDIKLEMKSVNLSHEF